MRLKVTVSSKPIGLASGRFSCTWNEQGLDLSKDGQAFSFPIGTAVEHRPPNLLVFPIPDGELRFHVSTSSKFQSRLATDLAAFVREGGQVPAIGDYAIPLPLLALVFLPLAVPVLTGGSLVAAIASGVVAVLNFVLLQNERHPVKTRALWLLCTNAVLFAAFAPFFFFLR